MRVVVSIKRVVDYNIRVRPLADGSGVATAGLKMGMNPFDENALEEALRLRERGVVTEVLAVSFGGAGVQEVLRHALALGADRALWGQAPDVLDQLTVARLLRHVAQRENPRLLLLGKQSIDEDAGQTAGMLAALLDWPAALAASEITVGTDAIKVVREIDGGTETLRLALPAVVSADLRLNNPRFAKLPDMMKARRLPIETLDCTALGVDLVPVVRLQSVAEPPARAVACRVGSVTELVDKLREEARVIA